MAALCGLAVSCQIHSLLHRKGGCCRWLAAQHTHQAHCMFTHRHAYTYITAWDTDEFPILLTPGDSMPALLERALGDKPKMVAAAFHR